MHRLHIQGKKVRQSINNRKRWQAELVRALSELKGVTAQSMALFTLSSKFLKKKTYSL
jgi:hypothetical protein